MTPTAPAATGSARPRHLGALTAATAPARTQRSWRRVLAAGGDGLLLLAGAFALVTAANISTALHPSAALVGFLAGGA